VRKELLFFIGFFIMLMFVAGMQSIYDEGGLAGFLIGFQAVQQEGTQIIHVKQASLSDHECDDTEWHFVINQIPSGCEHPASIHVYWDNGQDAIVPLSSSSGPVAHYTTNLYLSSYITDATAEICNSWSGQFVLSHGPCKPTAVTLVYFTGECKVEVKLVWGTGSEMKTLGFNIYRSEDKNGPWTMVNADMIYSKGMVTGDNYEWQDTNVESGKTYYYELEEVDYSGSTRYGPIKVTAGCDISEITQIKQLTVFVSSQKFTGHLAGIDGADQKCQAMADKAGLSGSFKAWLSNDANNINAKSRFSTTNLPYYSPNGVKIADDLNDFLDGDGPDHGITFDEYGKNVLDQEKEVYVLTGTNNDGSKIADENCNNWRTEGPRYMAAYGRAGNALATKQRWSYWSSARVCGKQYRIYCFEDVE